MQLTNDSKEMTKKQTPVWFNGQRTSSDQFTVCIYTDGRQT